MRWQNRLFLISSGISVFGTSLTNICALSMAINLNSFYGVSAVIVASYVAIMFAGILNGPIYKHVENLTTLRMTEFIRTLLILSLALAPIKSINILVTVVFFINFLEGIYHPSRFHFINNHFKETLEKNKFIAHLQSIDNSLQIWGPLIAGYIITFYPLNYCFMIDSLTYLVSFLFWFKVREVNIDGPPKQKFEKSVFEGYKTIFYEKKLFIMNVARTVGNYIFVYWKVLLPIILITRDKDAFARDQGICLSAMAAGLFITNFIIPRVASKDSNQQEKLFLYSSLVPVIISFPLLLIFKKDSFGGNFELIYLSLISFLFGISNAGFRTAGIIIGTRITEREKLPLVISASDSIIRPLTALIAILVSSILKNGITNANYKFLAIALFACSLVSFYLYQKVSRLKT